MGSTGTFGSSLGYGCPHCAGRGCVRCKRSAGGCTSCAQSAPVQVIEPRPVGLGYLNYLGTTDPTPPTRRQRENDELRPLGWLMLGSGIGWAASAYSTGRALDTPQLLATWGGGASAMVVLGLRRLTSGESGALWPTLLGAAMLASGYLLGETMRRPLGTRASTPAARQAANPSMPGVVMP